LAFPSRTRHLGGVLPGDIIPSRPTRMVFGEKINPLAH